MNGFKCMLAKPLDVKKLSFPCLVSPKLDGIRAQYYNGEFYTRNKNVVRGLSHLKETLSMMPKGIHFDGELMVPGMSFQQSSGLIRSFNEVPECCYYVFDLPYIDEDQSTRLATIKLILDDLKLPQVHLVDHNLIEGPAEILLYYKRFRDQGYEGAMVKNIHMPYVNTRSHAWMKIKEIETYDVLCVGFFEGFGRLTGTLGGIIVDLDGVKVRVGGGFSDADRDHIWGNRDTYRGRVCEIAGQERTKDGSLRHPRFITWRDDI